MKGMSNNYTVCKLRELFKSLSEVRLKSDYNIKLSIYKDESSEAPSSSHSLSGTVKCKILKAAALISLIVVFCSLISSLTSCLRFRK